MSESVILIRGLVVIYTLNIAAVIVLIIRDLLDDRRDYPNLKDRLHSPSLSGIDEDHRTHWRVIEDIKDLERDVHLLQRSASDIQDDIEKIKRDI